jgi:hypothetical protein
MKRQAAILGLALATLALSGCGSGADNAAGNAGTSTGELMANDTNGSMPESYPGQTATPENSAELAPEPPVGGSAATNSVSASGAAPATPGGGAAGAPGQ